jgi:D-3-phosphoglycerate dehydrogenase
MELLHQAGVTTEVLEDDQPETIHQAVRGADVVILRGPAKLTAETITEAAKLRVIGALGAGVDNIAVSAATAAGIPVVNGSGVAPRAVAEFCIGSAIAAHRNILGMHRAMVNDTVDWRTRLSLLAGTELSGTTFGVIGFGNIGREVARLARATFDARVVAFDPFAASGTTLPGVEMVESLDELLTASLTVTVNAALTEESRGMLGRRELELIGPEGIVVNAARGGIVDEDALIKVVSEGGLKGAVLDVFAEEPPDPEHIRRLAAVPGITLTPHMAGVTTASQEVLSRSVAAEVLAVLRGEVPTQIVNPEVLGTS